MHLPLMLALVASAAYSGANALVKRATPTLHLVGDSTMALHSASEGIQGWGEEIGTYLQDITVVNSARSGTSARSYNSLGYWYNVLQTIVSGDYVVIEFGHNDGGDPTTDTKGRADVYGESLTDSETVTIVNGSAEVVYTYTHYLNDMITDVQNKGATVIVSSQTPDNPYENSTVEIDSPPRFVPYALDIANARGVPYVDHFAAVISLFGKLGETTVDSYYPVDHTHTSPTGAVEVAWAFLSGLKCAAADGALAAYVNSAGQAAGARC